MTTEATSQIATLAERTLSAARKAGVMIATAESCTGGMIAAALTDIPGSSDAFDRAFVTYSNAAKAELLGVAIEHTRDPGAVSALVAGEMVQGALQRSNAGVAVSVTGIAGPGGGSDEKPVGLVYMATAKAGGSPQIIEHRFGKLGRNTVREATVVAALNSLINILSDH
ncbi:MAG: CinA family protein [Pseudomonadota bacterium]